MDYMEKVKQKRKELTEKLREQREDLDRTEKAIGLYPDIEEHSDRWGTKRLSSPSVNKDTDKVFIKHNCGCCPDSPLEAWPYKNVEGVRVFSKPAYFMVGEKNQWGFGEIEYPNWQEILRKENIPEKVIIQVQEFFNNNPPEDCED